MRSGTSSSARPAARSRERVVVPAVDRETWRRRRAALLRREKAHTREGDAIAAERRRLPMTEVAPVELVGPEGPTHSYLRTDASGRAVGVGATGERPGRPTVQWTLPAVASTDGGPGA